MESFFFWVALGLLIWFWDTTMTIIFGVLFILLGTFLGLWLFELLGALMVILGLIVKIKNKER